MKKRLVNIESLVMEEKLYPRKTTSWVTIYDYAESMRAGSKFPPVFVGEFKNTKFLLDGWHRVEATKQNKKTHIQAEIAKFTNKKDMFLEAIKRNAQHGKQYSFQEKIILAGKMKKMNISQATITKILGIRKDKLKTVVEGRVTSTVMGDPIVLKGPATHMINQIFSDEEKDAHSKITGFHSQISMLEMVVDMLDTNMFDLTDKKVVEKLMELKKSLNTALKLVK